MKCFSIVYQHDSMLCGVACLKMICKYFGREYSSDSLSKLCFATTEGVSMLGINGTAKTLGIETVCAKATPKELCETPLPCILHWNQNHFVVLYKVKKGKKFYVADPGKGKTTYNLEDFKQQAINNNRTYEFITSMQEIKLQDCEQRKCKEWEETQVNLFRVQQKSLKLQQTQEAGSIFINEVKNIVVTVVAATAVIHSQMALGMMLAVQYIIGQLNSPVEQLMNFFYSVQDVKISLERINEIHQMDDENGKEGLKTAVDNPSDGIHIDHIMFKYDPHALSKTIDDVDIHIPQGKVTAIVGASGSGKTTLIRLMLGYYSVLEGKITIGNTDVNQLDKKWWRRQCGVVMQDGVIFSESIERNIAVDDGEIDEGRLMQAADIACIRDYVMALPLKFNTKIGRDGVGLSQGQKQRILIARAVYKNPDYIFLDEATNSLDANNERHIVENLNTFYQGKTVVIVAHRLSTVKNADQIIVLYHGKVVEVGNHESLTLQHGAYYNLVKNQLELGS